MLFGAVPSINVFCVKVNGMEDAANSTIGPTSIWGLASHTKQMQWNQLFGDFAYAPMGYGMIFDSDVNDHPINDLAPA